MRGGGDLTPASPDPTPALPYIGEGEEREMNVFIDCGAFQGVMIKKFMKGPRYTPDFKLYAFECNPALAGTHYGAGVTVIKSAIWTYDGELSFYLNRKFPARTQGSSAFREKITGNLDSKHPVTVKCIDFSRWLKDNFTIDDEVIVKMNVEGAEYPVLEKCVETGTITLIRELHIQWHYEKIGVDRSRHDALITALIRTPGRESLRIYNGYENLWTKA